MKGVSSSPSIVVFVAGIVGEPSDGEPSVVDTGAGVGKENEFGGATGLEVGGTSNGWVPVSVGLGLEGNVAVGIVGAAGSVILGARSDLMASMSISDSSRSPLSRIS